MLNRVRTASSRTLISLVRLTRHLEVEPLHSRAIDALRSNDRSLTSVPWTLYPRPARPSAWVPIPHEQSVPNEHPAPGFGLSDQGQHSGVRPPCSSLRR